MVQVGISRDLRVQVQERNGCFWTSIDKITLPKGLEHETYQ